jgi:hypothetical protein
MFCREVWVWMFLKVMARHKTKCPESHEIFLPTTVLQLFLRWDWSWSATSTIQECQNAKTWYNCTKLTHLEISSLASIMHWYTGPHQLTGNQGMA